MCCLTNGTSSLLNVVKVALCIGRRQMVGHLFGCQRGEHGGDVGGLDRIARVREPVPQQRDGLRGRDGGVGRRSKVRHQAIDRSDCTRSNAERSTCVRQTQAIDADDNGIRRKTVDNRHLGWCREVGSQERRVAGRRGASLDRTIASTITISQPRQRLPCGLSNDIASGARAGDVRSREGLDVRQVMSKGRG